MTTTKEPATAKPRKIDPKSLTGDVAPYKESTNTAEYWWGTLHADDDPRGTRTPYIIIGGVSFPVEINPILRHDKDSGETAREHLKGMQGPLNEDQIRRIEQVMPRMFVRYGPKDQDGNRPTRIVTLPDPENVERARKEAEKLHKPYLPPAPPDGELHPISKFVYLVKAKNRERQLPPPVSELGIELP